ncbi:AmmeMemoRadiSam system protein B [Rhodobium gokarnense]|uniref:MEMO1 family protein M2319_000570 n=1 Tax=Rhodobium gokarnense TaxID=364296 RepID=A0ABT3H7E7_9HYPH|nr:AmmeMemoRadiSam system protein B [Rhodobium gokarnense]MCW2306254.1 AmmeMemoRadiSam system protein B/AmmeMemoRadiSam system protein A [Rhodobium gokarnense]
MTDGSTMRNVHPPQVAGMFYPGDAKTLDAMLDDCFADARTADIGTPKVLVVPHAGYVYSGAVAASAYRLLERRADAIRRVVLVGPAHRYPVHGIATTSAERWHTPLGDVPVDLEAVSALARMPELSINDSAFRGEHSLEVQLPFLQETLGDFSLVPLLAGDIRPERLADALSYVWGGAETLIVVSSDLSHFHDYDTAKRLDGATVAKIETLAGIDLDGGEACGCRGISAALIEARRRDLRVTALDVRNSGDTAGDRNRVVGYAAFAMEDAATAELSKADRDTLIRAAGNALAEAVETRQMPEARLPADLSPPLRAPRATFVTLHLDGALRGCIGNIVPSRPLYADVIESAYKAGFADRRFAPLTASELPRLTIDISILSWPRPISFADEADLLTKLRPGVDGLILEAGPHRGLFLPAVWQSLPEPRAFLAHLKDKAGIGDAPLPHDSVVRRFVTESFGGPFMAS